MTHTFKSAGKLITGVNASEQLPDFIHALHMTKVLVLTDKIIEQTDAFQRIIADLTAKNIEFTVYNDITPEPEIQVVKDTKVFFTKQAYDGIVAIGGGSVIDTAKCVSVYGNADVELESLFGEGNVAQKGLPLIVLPTTAGTGSEVTNIAILSDPSNQVKKGIVSDYMLPDVAIVAPELTVSCPPSVTAASGVDALVHAIEAYISVNASAVTDALAIQAMTLIFKALPTAYNNPTDLSAREAMCNGSVLAGLAFGSAGVGAVHALAYPLGGRFHLSHGVSNALLLPYVMQYNKVNRLEKFSVMANCFGLTVDGLSKEDTANAVTDALFELCEQVNIPKGLKQFDIPKDVIPALAEEAIKIERLLRNNPTVLTLQDITDIYTQAYE